MLTKRTKKHSEIINTYFPYVPKKYRDGRKKKVKQKGWDEISRFDQSQTREYTVEEGRMKRST